MATNRKPRKRVLTQEEIIELLEQSDFSDLSEDSDSDDSYSNLESNSSIRINEDECDDKSEKESAVVDNTKIVTETRKLLWIKKKMPQRGPQMEDDGEFNEENEKEPLELFFEYFNLEFWEELSTHRQIYILYNNVSTNRLKQLLMS
ncbi:hypothetical protein AVEN_40063-1 [Araneus ventricosus]|uniref:Uncharacterized protein n=1 Tax=Araneus ventricosus TaxID=182803 RepID=A0A4Y2MRG1_ARAVE|nr:hypothetical protein AVEN_40063-1 [Araneus ventricosus]